MQVNNSEWQRIVFGILSSCTARTLVSPFDVFKIVSQVGGNSHYLYQTLYESPFPHNILPLWTSNLLSCIRLLPYQLFKYIIISDLKRTLKNHRRRRQIGAFGGLEEFVLSVASTVGAAAVTYPITNLRVRLVAQLALTNKIYEGPLDALKKVLDNEGWSGLFTGFWPVLAGVIVFESASFLGFKLIRYLKRAERDSDTEDEEEEEESSVISHLIEGTCVTCFATILAHPFEVIGRRLLTQYMFHHAGLYKNSLDCVQKLFKEQGLGWLFGGLLPALLRVAPYALCVLFTYRLLCVISAKKKTHQE